jgi:hypothetical protein
MRDSVLNARSPTAWSEVAKRNHHPNAQCVSPLGSPLPARRIVASTAYLNNWALRRLTEQLGHADLRAFEENRWYVVRTRLPLANIVNVILFELIER